MSCNLHPGTPGQKVWHRGPKNDWRVLESLILCDACVAQTKADGVQLFLDQAGKRPLGAPAPAPAKLVVPEVEICKVPGCTKKFKAVDRCDTCYRRALQNGWLDLEPEGDARRWHANIRLRAEAGSGWHKRELQRLAEAGEMLPPPPDHDPWYRAQLGKLAPDDSQPHEDGGPMPSEVGGGGDDPVVDRASEDERDMSASESTVHAVDLDALAEGGVVPGGDEPEDLAQARPLPRVDARLLSLSMEIVELRRALTAASERLAAHQLLARMGALEPMPTHAGDASWSLLRALVADIADGRLQLRHLLAQGDRTSATGT